MINKILLAVLFTISISFSESKAGDSKAPPSQNAPIQIDKTKTPEIGGIKEVIEIRTDDASEPVLLFLYDSSDSSMINDAPVFTSILKNRFTIAQWDQRDAGKTLILDFCPVRPFVALMKKDTLEVISFVREELKQEKIYMLSSS